MCDAYERGRVKVDFFLLRVGGKRVKGLLVYLFSVFEIIGLVIL